MEHNSELPGNILGVVSLLISVITVASLFMYSSWRSRKIKRILQDHFYDWKEKGIQVEYYPPSGDEYNNVPGHISLTLPQTVPAVSESVQDQNYYSFENSTNVQSV